MAPEASQQFPSNQTNQTSKDISLDGDTDEMTKTTAQHNAVRQQANAIAAQKNIMNLTSQVSMTSNSDATLPPQSSAEESGQDQSEAELAEKVIRGAYTDLSQINITPAIKLYLSAAKRPGPATEYGAAFDKGYDILSRKIYEEESKKRNQLLPSKFDTFCGYSNQVLMPIPPAILSRVITGDLAKAHLLGQDKELNQIMTRWHHPRVLNSVPCIYEITFCNNKGEGPTVVEWRKILDAMRQYADVDNESDTLAQCILDIDTVLHPGGDSTLEGCKYGVRRYISPPSDAETAQGEQTLNTESQELTLCPEG